MLQGVVTLQIPMRVDTIVVSVNREVSFSLTAIPGGKRSNTFVGRLKFSTVTSIKPKI